MRSCKSTSSRLFRMQTMQNLAWRRALHTSESVVHSPLKKLFIANRGEIACRIIRSAQKMGIRTVAAWSDADKHSMHVTLADESVRLGPSMPSMSYLNVERVLEAAKSTGADSIHPGYGFLSEDGNFAQAVIDSGITYVGPTPDSIVTMGQKNNAKAAMEKAGVPVIPGYHGSGQEIEVFAKACERIGYPVMIKAAFGGGGKGMRVVRSAKDLAQALESAQEEAITSFGDGACLVEKLVEGSRHIEVQIFGDKHGNAVHMLERDCSTQRRHQKLLEEAPAPSIPDNVRKAMHDAAVRAAQAVNYVGAGTVEFLLNPSTNDFYFLEMNTRLQVEHTVTEMITDLDLVEWQLRIAAGEPLPMEQDEIVRRSEGCFALEARICAEQVDRAGFSPSAGTLNSLVTLPENVFIRVDTGFREKHAILPYYDSMITKIIVRSFESRADALSQLDYVLRNTAISGVATNVTYLRAILNDPVYQAGEMTTDYIEGRQDELMSWCENQRDLALIVAAACVSKRMQMPFGARNVWGMIPKQRKIKVGGEVTEVLHHDGEFEVKTSKGPGLLQGFDFESEDEQWVRVNRKSLGATVRWDFSKQDINVWIDGRHFQFPFEVVA